MAVKKIDEATFSKEVLQASFPVLVDFNAEWCGPCKMLEPVLKAVAEQLGDKIKVVSIKTDDNPNVAGQYNITGIPCLIIFKNGQEVKRLVGYQPEAALKRQIESLL